MHRRRDISARETYGLQPITARLALVGTLLALFFTWFGPAPSATAGTPDAIVPVPEPNCLTPTNPCNTVTFEYDRLDTTPLRGYSVTFLLSNLDLCAGVGGSFTELNYLSDYCGSGCTAFKIVDNGGGSYTVDAAILGADCGPVGSGSLFSVAVTGGTDGFGSVEVTSVIARDCVNGPVPALAGPDAAIEIDSVGPAAVFDLGAKPEPQDNDTDGTISLVVKFTTPAEAVSLEIYRAPYVDAGLLNAYPEYDDIPTAGPPALPGYPPPAPWVLTPITASGTSDEIPVRGLWYYVVFTFDACGNPSPVSSLTAGAMNYHLGDVSNGVSAGTGDNSVDVADMSLLGVHYGSTLTFGDPFNFLDVGPTVDGSIDTRPLTDDVVDFEDLMLFVLNYGAVSVAPSPAVLFDAADPGPFAAPVAPATRVAPAARGALTAPTAPVAPATPAIPAALGLVALPSASMGVERVGLVLQNNLGRLQGAHAVVDLGGRTFLSATLGALVDRPVFFKSLRGAGTVTLDLAGLGPGATIDGDGILVVLELRGPAAADLGLGDVSLRDSRNREIGESRLASMSGSSRFSNRSGAVGGALSAASDPPRMSSELGVLRLKASPNPFQAGTTISFQVPQEGKVTFRVFSPLGRQIVRQSILARSGHNTVFWDGRSADGALVSSGLYLYDIEMAGRVSRGKLFLAR